MLKPVFAGTLSLFVVGCGRASFIPPDQIKPLADVSQPDTRLDLPQVLARLDLQLTRHSVAARPGISESDLGRLRKSLPCPLPPLLERLYRWHDGVASLIPYYDFLPLADMVEEYRQIRKIEIDVGIPEGEGFKRTYLPILRFDGQEQIVVDCADERRAPLIDYFNESPSYDVRYRGIGHFLSVTLSAYEAGAYRMRRGHRDVDPVALSRAYRINAVPSEIAWSDANYALLQEPLRNGAADAFEQARGWIEHRPDGRYITILRTRVHDADPQVASRAAFSLGQMRAQEAQEDLASLLAHPSAEVRNFAAAALSELDRISPGPTIDLLVKLLDDRNDMVRISAIEALATARSPGAVGPLLELLPQVRPGIQQYIVDALGSIRDPAALDALRALRASVAAQDRGQPDRGGTRGSDPPPSRLLVGIDAAIQAITVDR
jgi:hypothetical protein